MLFEKIKDTHSFRHADRIDHHNVYRRLRHNQFRLSYDPREDYSDCGFMGEIKKIKDTHSLGAATSAERHNNYTYLRHCKRTL